MKELNDIIIKYIEDNKVKHNIDYEDTINAIKQLIDEIEEEYIVAKSV